MPPATPLPYITSYPDAGIRQDILSTAGSELWDNLITTWISLVQYYLRLPATNTMSPSMRAFLESYVTASAEAGTNPADLTEDELHLRASVFSLITKKDDGDGEGGKYIIVDGIAVTGVWGFIQTFGRSNTTEVQRIVRHLYASRGGKTFVNLLMDAVLGDPALLSTDPEASARLVEALCIVLVSGPAVARDWITVKWFDMLQKLYLGSTADAAKVSLLRVASASFCVPPLAVLDSNVRIRVLSDVISKATSAPDKHSQLLSALLNYTNFTALIGVPSLTMSLETAKLRIPLVSSPLNHKKKQPKSKRHNVPRPAESEPVAAAPVDDVPEEAVSMLLDLFPQLSVPAVSDVIRNNGGSAELATSFLLENPDELAKYENFTVPAKPAPAPVSTPKRDKGKIVSRPQPPSNSGASSSSGSSNNTKNRSIYDNDDLSNLKVGTGKLIFGKKEKLSLNKLGKAYTDDKSLQATLERIYQADEDEHDDTYDDAEVSHPTAVPTLTDETDDSIAKNAIRNSRKSTAASTGPADADLAGGSPAPAAEPAPLSEAEALEAFLLDYYGSHKEEFSKAARRTRARAEIRKRTNWTDEQIEGWARMLERDPSRKNRLENRYMLANSAPRNQGLLKSTAWRQAKVNSDGEEEEEENNGRSGNNNNNNRRRPQNRPPLDPKVQAQRKDRNKARQGNHSRKAGHAKKMERAGGVS